MKYTEYRDRIQGRLQSQPDGLTWAELRDQLDLPYERACPAWTKRLEQEIGLTRVKGAGRALVWKVMAAGAKPRRRTA
jgi:hypothetical protein